MRRIASISYHTSPLAVPGEGDAGGLNVYLADLAVHVARTGIAVDVYTRRADESTPDVVELSSGARVLQVDAGPARPLPKDELFDHVEEFSRAVTERIAVDDEAPCALHSHYWMSGAAGLRIARKIGVPVVHTAHTLARSRAMPDGGPARIDVETELAQRADLLVAATAHETEVLVRRYGADPRRVTVIPPGVDHTVFRPDDRAVARRSLGLPLDGFVVLYCGRIQELKGADVAGAAMAVLSTDCPEVADRTTFVVAGGPSGPDGPAVLAGLRRLAADERMHVQFDFRPPRRHGAVAELYAAADVCIVPSRSESFGLVALEAQSCGVPVVASAVDGLTHIVGDGGLLVAGHDPADYARAVAGLLVDPMRRRRMGTDGAATAAGFSWELTAARHVDAYAGLLSPDGVAVCG
jgi:D-inositol-3-phosphate glycosyltransferase